MTDGDVKAIDSAEDAALAHVTGDDADGIGGLVEGLSIVGDVGAGAADAAGPGIVRVAILPSYFKDAVLVAEGMGDDHVIALLGVLAQDAGLIALGDKLRVGGLDALVSQGVEGVVRCLVPRIVVPRTGQHQGQGACTFGRLLLGWGLCWRCLSRLFCRWCGGLWR